VESVKIEDSSGQQSSEKRDGLVGSHRFERIYTSASVISAECIIVMCVITVGNAVQINHSRLSSVYLNYLSRIPGHAAS
jgi:hypothetical protein